MLSAKRRAADLEAHFCDAEVAAAEQRHRAFDAAGHQVAVRRFTVGEPEFAAEVPGGHVRAAGEGLYIQWPGVLAVHPVADAAQPGEVTQVLCRGCVVTRDYSCTASVPSLATFQTNFPNSNSALCSPASPVLYEYFHRGSSRGVRGHGQSFAVPELCSLHRSGHAACIRSAIVPVIGGSRQELAESSTCAGQSAAFSCAACFPVCPSPVPFGEVALEASAPRACRNVGGTRTRLPCSALALGSSRQAMATSVSRSGVYPLGHALRRFPVPLGAGPPWEGH